ncbi:MAG: FkbM family methyltransferase [Alphaproteobacteria bacterium]|nr:FkbM family methyltransferase [Alphaproteobacteria bacterium]
MKFEYGYYFPDDELHFQPFLEGSEYQIVQREMGIGVCRALNVPFRCAVDIGAHVGLWAKPLAGLFDKVICFEPRLENFACLEKNMAGLACDLFPFGLSDREATMTFHMPSDICNSGAGSLEPFADASTQSMVKVRPLDNMHIPEINFIKIDVQGWEAQVLIGGHETLQRNAPVILCENHPQRSTLVEQFAALGYEKILRVVKEDIFVPHALLTPATRQAIMHYFNERRAFFEGLM